MRKPFSKFKISEMKTHKENKEFGHSLPCRTLRPFFDRIKD